MREVIKNLSQSYSLLGSVHTDRILLFHFWAISYWYWHPLRHGKNSSAIPEIWCNFAFWTNIVNKTVLLRERKRHTDRGVTSTGGGGGGGTPAEGSTPAGRVPQPGGYPSRGVLQPGGTPARVPPHLDLGWGTPHLELDGVPPHLDLGWGTLPSGPGMGYPPHLELDGVPPPTWTWDGVPPHQPDGVPPPRVWTDKQTENITSSRTTYAVGN